MPRGLSSETGQNPLPRLQLHDYGSLIGDLRKRFGLRWRNLERNLTLEPAVWRAAGMKRIERKNHKKY